METFQEHYLSMKRTIAARKLNVDMALIDRAVDYARVKHKDQKRKDGSPYIIHPLAVAEIVAEIGLDTDAILGALLHDCIEDTDSTYDDIARNFGPTVASLVEGVTKLTRVEYSTLEEQQMENLRKMFMAMSKDIRVILIKIADRLHNTRTMQFQSPESRSPSPARPWTSMRRWPTGSACRRSNGSWRIPASNTSIPRAITRSCAISTPIRPRRTPL